LEECVPRGEEKLGTYESAIHGYVRKVVDDLSAEEEDGAEQLEGAGEQVERVLGRRVLQKISERRDK
jgi:hypothetical protein